jgi:hypothetical protein
MACSGTSVPIHFEVALLDPASGQLWVPRDETENSLVSITAPSGRLAYSLAEELESRYGVATIQLALLPRNTSSAFAIHEVRAASELGAKLTGIEFDQLDEETLRDDERDLLQSILKRRDTGQGRFARLGWIDELLVRIEPFLTRRNQRATGLIRHFNAGIDFSLLWIQTDAESNLWFKAVGEPNTREFAITLELASVFPNYLPRIVCAMPDWNAWVSEDVEGLPLGATSDESTIATTLRVLAFLQQHAIADLPRLRQLGAIEWPLSRVLALQDEFFADMPSIMAAQTSTRSRPLTASELVSLQSAVLDASAEFMAIGIPDSLVHGDIGHGNIQIKDGRPVFLDWAETYIGHPFLTAEHLLVDLERSLPDLSSQQRVRLRNLYLAEWKGLVSEHDLTCAARLMPAIAAFAYAVILWSTVRVRPDPTPAGPLLRSLVRRLQRELEPIMEAQV